MTCSMASPIISSNSKVGGADDGPGVGVVSGSGADSGRFSYGNQGDDLAISSAIAGGDFGEG